MRRVLKTTWMDDRCDPAKEVTEPLVTLLSEVEMHNQPLTSNPPTLLHPLHSIMPYRPISCMHYKSNFWRITYFETALRRSRGAHTAGQAAIRTFRRPRPRTRVGTPRGVCVGQSWPTPGAKQGARVTRKQQSHAALCGVHYVCRASGRAGAAAAPPVVSPEHAPAC